MRNICAVRVHICLFVQSLDRRRNLFREKESIEPFNRHHCLAMTFRLCFIDDKVHDLRHSMLHCYRHECISSEVTTRQWKNNTSSSVRLKYSMITNKRSFSRNIIITIIINIDVDRLKRHRVLSSFLLNKVEINVMRKALNMIVDDWSLALNEKIFEWSEVWRKSIYEDWLEVRSSAMKYQGKRREERTI